ncbi:MAG TPA: SpvB/TcaC N-terminal domain-containing protein, partial [Polyangia bacterium]|nr:SpvB/TcaC N-terminal domain-containing protein [Polyangia bacterium]
MHRHSSRNAHRCSILAALILALALPVTGCGRGGGASVHRSSPAPFSLDGVSPAPAALPLGDNPADVPTSSTGLFSGTFAVDPGGAATYTVRVEVPPGTNGVEPHLTLAYGSQHGNGYLGLGWTLQGISAISRCSATGENEVHNAVHYDAGDRFCLDGIRLVAVSGSYGADATLYRTEKDATISIVSHGSCGSGP